MRTRTVTGGAVSYWDSIGDRDIIQGESNPEFIRAPTPPPAASACRVNTQAKSAGGAALGWYTRKTC